MSHAITATIETAATAAVMSVLKSPRPAATAAVIVSTYYYGREAGQREHDLKRAGQDPLSAYFGARFAYGWSSANVQQWIAPTLAAWAVAGLVELARRRRGARTPR